MSIKLTLFTTSYLIVYIFLYYMQFFLVLYQVMLN